MKSSRFRYLLVLLVVLLPACGGGGDGGSSNNAATPALVSIAVTPPNPSISDGNTQQFVATGTYSDSSTKDVTTLVTWSSSNDSVAGISNAAGSNGIATSLSEGTTTIKATSGSI